ncbi:MAG TPA: hypothetical protein VMT70_20390 [Vicinamibacteria bacterium]|nr:hypothetical protein [Vicinamibacteria bacterium]
MARAWVPRPSAAKRILGLDLSAREGYVLSRIDGAIDIDQLGQVTGLPSEEVRLILDRLVREGAIEPPEAPPTPAEARDGLLAVSAPAVEPSEATHRQLFESRLHPRSEEERRRLASVAEEPELCALCFDPVPAVIHRLLENPRTGLTHARLIAANHRNPVGLEALAARSAFLGDREVQRLLLRNNQSPETIVRRLLAARPLPQIYEACQSHDLPERHRHTARGVLRGRFSGASPDERVHLILTTEGRALGTLSGLALDGRSVALLCARGATSALLVENLACWPGTPPALIAHLLKQPLVRQSPTLKLLLHRHPNCPRSTP